MSNFNYFNVVLKSSFLITKNEIWQTIKRCKSNNASEFDDILNRIFKIFVKKLMSHLMNLFRVCAALSYHSRCFREIHIIVLKKSKKRITWNVKMYKSIALLNIFDKDEFRRESLLEQTISCKIEKSILSWKRNKRLWTTLTSTYCKNHQCHQFCICFTMRIYWNFLNNRRVKWLSSISWTTLTFSFTTLTRSTIVDCWRKCMNIVCCEIVVTKSSLRRLNMNWYI
jgi:hypothetical protein